MCNYAELDDDAFWEAKWAADHALYKARRAKIDRVLPYLLKRHTTKTGWCKAHKVRWTGLAKCPFMSDVHERLVMVPNCERCLYESSQDI